MLVLSRKKNEQIVIGEGKNQVVITLIEIRSTQYVRIGFDADRTVKIVRRELLNCEEGVVA